MIYRKLASQAKDWLAVRNGSLVNNNLVLSQEQSLTRHVASGTRCSVERVVQRCEDVRGLERWYHSADSEWSGKWEEQARWCGVRRR